MDPWLQEVVANMDQVRMIAPAIIAALIAGGGSLLGGLFGGGKTHKPERVSDPFKDPLMAMLSQYFQTKVGKEKPAYPGELSAPPNEMLMQLIQMMMGQQEGVGSLVNKFSDPAGAQGWNPVSAGWNRVPMGAPGGNKGATSGISPEIAQFIASRMGMGG